MPKQPDADTDVTSITTEVAFPPGAPKPHEGRRWSEWLQRRLVDEDLVDIANERIPAGKFSPLWSTDSMRPPPPLDPKASWGDRLKHREFEDRIDRRKAENVKIKAERDDWWRTENNRYFVITTDSMIKTNPNMRELFVHDTW